MIEKNGTGIQMAEVGSTGVEKSGTGIRRRGGLRALVEKNGTGMRAISSAVMLLAMSMATASVAQERVSGYVIVEGEHAGEFDDRHVVPAFGKHARHESPHEPSSDDAEFSHGPVATLRSNRPKGLGGLRCPRSVG